MSRSNDKSSRFLTFRPDLLRQLKRAAWKLRSVVPVVSYEDLLQEAEIAAYSAFIKMVDIQDATRDSVLGYLVKRGRGAMLDHIRTMGSRNRGNVERFVLLPLEEDWDTPHFETPEACLEAKQSIAWLAAKAALRTVGGYSHLAILEMLLDGMTRNEIAKKVGVTSSRVCQIVKLYKPDDRQE